MNCSGKVQGAGKKAAAGLGFILVKFYGSVNGERAKRQKKAAPAPKKGTGGVKKGIKRRGRRFFLVDTGKKCYTKID